MAASSQPETAKGPRPRFFKEDLVITMPKPSDWDELSSEEKFTAKYDFVKQTCGAQHFFLAGHRDANDETPPAEQIRISSIYATFDFGEPWSGLNNNRRRTTKRLAELRLLTAKPRGRKRERGYLVRHDGVTGDDVGKQHGLTHGVAAEAVEGEEGRYKKRQKRLPVQNDAGFDVEADRTAVRGSSTVIPGDNNCWSNPSRSYILSTDATQAPVEVAKTSKPVQRGVPSTQRPGGTSRLAETLARYSVAELTAVSQELDSPVHDWRSWPSAQRATDNLGSKSPNFAERYIEQPRVISKPLPGYHAPYQGVKDMQPTASDPQRSVEPSLTASVTLKDLLVKVVPWAWSREQMAAHQKVMKTEVTAQYFGTLDIVSANLSWCMKHLDLQKAEAQRRLQMDFIESEKRWMASHPHLISEDINSLRPIDLANRQLARLAIDVSLERGDISRLPEAALKVHFADVQGEAMSRQLVLLKAWSHVKKLFAEKTTKPVAAPSSQNIVALQERSKKVENKDAETIAPASTYLLPKRDSFLREGSLRPAAQEVAALVDEQGGKASVVGAVGLAKQTDPGSSGGRQQESPKRKQEAERSASGKRLKTIGTEAATSKGFTLSLLDPLQSQAQSTDLAGGSQTTTSGINWHTGSSFLDWETRFEPYGTVNPPNLRLTNFIAPSSSFPKPNSNAPAPTVRIFKDVPREATKAAYELVSEEERAINLVRHRQASELSPEVGNAPLKGARVGGFFYVTPVESDNFGFDDELEVAEDETRGFDLDSRGLWKW